VIQAVLGGALTGAAWAINKGAALVAPSRELDVFPHRLYAKGAAWRHLDAYRMGPGWVAIEFGPWTVEAAWRTAQEVAAART
jgi:hypothetical protein